MLILCLYICFIIINICLYFWSHTLCSYLDFLISCFESRFKLILSLFMFIIFMPITLDYYIIFESIKIFMLNGRRDNNIICAHHHFPMVKSPKYIVPKNNKKKKTLYKLIFPMSNPKNKIKNQTKYHYLGWPINFPMSLLLPPSHVLFLFLLHLLPWHLPPNPNPLLSFLCFVFKKKLFVFSGHELIVGKSNKIIFCSWISGLFCFVFKKSC